MPVGRRRYLIGYDIRDEKRLRKVHKIVKAHGFPLQYSLFLGDLDGVEFNGLRSELVAAVDLSIDEVVFVDLGMADEDSERRFSFLGPHPELPRRRATII